MESYAWIKTGKTDACEGAGCFGAQKAIISRQIKEGETLALEATAQELGVSITPVREAFQILARDGLLELKQNKGATVLGVTEKTLRDHYQIRAVLEGYACVLCVETGQISLPCKTV